ncbi:MAG: ABC transporter ATP-binding protein [Planctomycetes bacterium]|nr:ABC transporter ATP-binding protein [Planctomycetota bacterium]
MSYLRRRQGGILVGIATLTACNLCELAQPRIWKWIIDRIGEGAATRSALAAGVCAMLVAALGRSAFSLLQRWFLLGTARRIEYDLRNDLFRHLQRLPPSYFARVKTGDLMSRSTSDVNAVRLVLGLGVMHLIDTLNLLGVSIFFMVHTSPRLTLVAMTPLAILPFLSARFTREIHRRYEKVQEHLSVISTKVQENIAGVRVVKAFVQEGTEIVRFGRLNEEYIRRVLHEARIEAPFNPLLGFCAALGKVAALSVGGVLVAREELGLGDYISFYGFLEIATWPMNGFGHILTFWQKGRTSMGRLQEVLTVAPEIADAPGAVTLPAVRGVVSLRGLTVRYEGAHHPALDTLTLDIPAGAFVAVVGSVGAGKSTLLSAIARLVKVPDGELLVDGVDVNRLSLACLRGAMGMVPQETFLFSDTVRNNIAFGRMEATDAQVRAAARLAQVDEEIRAFPMGYSQLLGERGVTLSGGQRQRVALARAVLREPSILLLDNSLSSVDAQTEEAILGGLRTFLRGRTAIVVSHRVSAVRDADRILVLDRGRIVEDGTDAQLRARGGEYAWLCERQAAQEALAGA